MIEIIGKAENDFINAVLEKKIADHWRTLNFSRHGFMSGVGFPDSLHEMISIVPLVAAEVGCISLCVTCRSQIASTENMHLMNFIHQQASHCLSLLCRERREASPEGDSY